MVDEKIIYEILKSREDRSMMQRDIIKEYKSSLISFTLNIPGPKKDSLKYRQIFNKGMEEILNRIEDKQYKILYRKTLYKITGPEGFLAIDEDPRKLKDIMVDIEEKHSLGRIFDIDVFDSNHKQINRQSLGLEPRRCLICEKEAKICNRLRTHSLEELLREIDKISKI